MSLTLKEAENYVYKLLTLGFGSINSEGSKLLLRLALKAFGVSVVDVEAKPLIEPQLSTQVPLRPIAVTTPTDIAKLLYLSGSNADAMIKTIAAVLSKEQLQQLISEVNNISDEAVLQIAVLQDKEKNSTHKISIITKIQSMLVAESQHTSKSGVVTSEGVQIAKIVFLAETETRINFYLGLQSLNRATNTLFMQYSPADEGLKSQILSDKDREIAIALRKNCRERNLSIEDFDFMVGVSGEDSGVVTIGYLAINNQKLSKNLEYVYKQILSQYSSSERKKSEVKAKLERLEIRYKLLSHSIQLFETQLSEYLSAKAKYQSTDYTSQNFFKPAAVESTPVQPSLHITKPVAKVPSPPKISLDKITLSTKTSENPSFSLPLKPPATIASPKSAFSKPPSPNANGQLPPPVPPRP